MMDYYDILSDSEIVETIIDLLDQLDLVKEEEAAHTPSA